jgi:hypothetical protein
VAAPPPSEPALLAVAALDDFIAEIVRQAHAAGVRVPPLFFDWASGEGTRLVEQLVQQRLDARAVSAPAPGLVSALRCSVRYWVAPWVVARFTELRPLFPELWVSSQGDQLSVLVREGRWRCASGPQCVWKLCERGT